MITHTLDFVPQTVYSMSRQYAKAKKAFPTLFMKLYTYQLCRSLAYIHSLGVCHRDIKPQNFLIVFDDGPRGWPRPLLCDFETARELQAERDAALSTRPTTGSACAVGRGELPIRRTSCLPSRWASTLVIGGILRTFKT